MSSGKQTENRVFVTRQIFESALTRLAAAARVEVWEDETPPPHEELVARIRDADGVISMVSDRFDAATIAGAPRLRVISNFAVGFDNIDVGAATQAHIAVGHTPGILTETTADLAFALLLATARRLVEADRFVREGRWRTWGPQVMLGHDVWGATLGIIGWGAIGQAVARRGAGFGMRILYMARPPKHNSPTGGSAHSPASHLRSATVPAPAAAERVELGKLLAESDFISLHVPLTPETRHLIGARELAMMKPGAILVNTARGEVVDQRALTEALKSGRLGGAGIDVTEREPIAHDDPLIELPNVVLTPHIGSASHATRMRMAELAVDNLLDALSGRVPRFCVNPEVKLKT